MGRGGVGASFMGFEGHALEMLGRKHGRPLERTEGAKGSSSGDVVAGVGDEPHSGAPRRSGGWSVRCSGSCSLRTVGPGSRARSPSRPAKPPRTPVHAESPESSLCCPRRVPVPGTGPGFRLQLDWGALEVLTLFVPPTLHLQMLQGALEELALSWRVSLTPPVCHGLESPPGAPGPAQSPPPGSSESLPLGRFSCISYNLEESIYHFPYLVF